MSLLVITCSQRLFFWNSICIRVVQRNFRDFSAHGENYAKNYGKNEAFWRKFEGQKVKGQGEILRRSFDGRYFYSFFVKSFSKASETSGFFNLRQRSMSTSNFCSPKTSNDLPVFDTLCNWILHLLSLKSCTKIVGFEQKKIFRRERLVSVKIKLSQSVESLSVVFILMLS